MPNAGEVTVREATSPGLCPLGATARRCRTRQHPPQLQPTQPRRACSQFGKQGWGDCVREETFCFTELILFPQNHSRQRLSSLPALIQSAANQAQVSISTALLQSPRGPAFPRKPAIGETSIHKAFCSKSALAAGMLAGKKHSRCSTRSPAPRHPPQQAQQAELRGTAFRKLPETLLKHTS